MRFPLAAKCTKYVLVLLGLLEETRALLNLWGDDRLQQQLELYLT